MGKKRRGMQGNYERIRRRCEREKNVKISQAVAIFVEIGSIECCEEWRRRKKRQKCYGFVHIRRNDPCQWLFFFFVNIFTVKISFNAIKYEPFYFSLFYYFCCRWVLRSPTFISIPLASAARERVKCVKNAFGKIFGQLKFTEKWYFDCFFLFWILLNFQSRRSGKRAASKQNLTQKN